MPSKTTIQNNQDALRTAKSNVKNQQSYAKTERTSTKSQINSGMSGWKGDKKNTFSKDYEILKKYYDNWISKWGWGDDGSINGVIDKIDQEIGDLESLWDSLWN